MSGLLALLAAFLAPPARGADAPFVVRRWGLENGLPTSTVHDIAQTPDGYLWLSTTGGLARFDGHDFEVFAFGHGLTTNRIQGLTVARDGALWASGEDGSLSRWDGRAFDVRPGVMPWPFYRIAELPDGSILGHVSSTLWWYRNGEFVAHPDSLNPWAWPIVDRAGVAWTKDMRNRPVHVVDGRIEVLGPPGSYDDQWIRDFRTGGVVYVRRNGRDAELFDAQLRRRVPMPGAGLEVFQLVDRAGRLWSAAGTAYVQRDVRDGRVLGRVELGLARVPFRTTLDRDDNLWIGTQTQGLIRVSPSPLRLLRPDLARPVAILGVAEMADGRVVCVDDGADYWRPEGDRRRLVAGWWEVRGDGMVPVSTPLEPRDSVRAGAVTYRSTRSSVELWSGAHRATIAGLQAPVMGTVADPRTPLALYVGYDAHVARIAGVPGPARVDTVIGFAAVVRSVALDRDGRLWVATTSGLWRIAPGDTQRFDRTHGLPTDHFRQLHVGRDGTLWIGTYGGGLVRHRDGRFATLDRRHGLLEDVVSTVLEDDDGNLWLAGNAGIQRVPIAQANEVLDGRRARVDAVGYDQGAGLRNPETTGYPGRRTRDGRLWFLTFDGLAVVDPKLARELLGSAPVPRVLSVSAGDRAIEPEDGAFRLGARERRFTIRYTGIDLRAAEQVRFRYRLEGFDRDWVDAGDARVATYTNVPPGRYEFRVEAVSGTGVRSAAPAAAGIALTPFPWETRWFQALALALIVAAIALAVRSRSRRLVERAAELQRAVDARTAELRDEKARTETALATVEAQAHRLEALDRARSRFFASISHEFRTPLTLVQGPLQDVRDGRHGTMRADAREQVAIALDSAARLQRLVDQLLDAARAEAGELRLDRRPADLVAFLEELTLGFAPLAERKRIAFERRLPAAPAIASFDPLALEKVFANLLGNAFKFTPEGGHVVLSATPAAGDAFEVSVADDGPGIAAEDLPRVFERFYRAERSVTRVQPGTGLGLALAHDMVSQHGGSIAVTSVEGRGSTFTVRLPLLAEAERPAVAPAAVLDPATLAALADEIRVAPEPPLEPAPPAADAPTVLVVDDHDGVRRYVARQLARHYRVIEAADGVQALARMREAAPDLVVSDVSMPVMDGFALVRAARADVELEDVPILLLTAAAGSDSRIAGLEGGADDYLTKPFEVRELLARISGILQARRRLRDRLARRAAATVVYGASAEAPAAMAPASAGESGDGAAPAPGPAAAARSAADAGFMRRLREVVDARMGDEDFDVDRLAEAMGMGRTLLYQRAGEVLGRTPMEVIFDHRLERAATLLASGEGGVGEVAYAIGFRSVSHFTHRFRERFGVTPSAWKRGERPAPSPPAFAAAPASTLAGTPAAD